MDPYLKKIIPKEDLERAKSRIPKTDKEMEEPIVRTKIDVGDLNLFRVFLDANDMAKFEIGYYIDYQNHNSAFKGVYGMNRICYSTKNSTYETDCSIMHMNIKYGSVEEAYKLFRAECNKMKAL